MLPLVGVAKFLALHVDVNGLRTAGGGAGVIRYDNVEAHTVAVAPIVDEHDAARFNIRLREVRDRRARLRRQTYEAVGCI